MNNVVYFSPETFAEAVDILTEQEGARVLAGGTDLIAKWKKSGCFDMRLVDIRKIPELKRIQTFPEGLFVGAGVSMAEVHESPEVVRKYPILAEAAGKVGSAQIRNMATIGGNACNAAPSADTVLPLIAYQAQVLIGSKFGECKSNFRDFFVGPGKSILERGSILKGFLIPTPLPKTRGFFVKHSRRVGMDLATVGVAMVLELDSREREVEGIRVVLGAVGPIPILVKGLDSVIGEKLESAELVQVVAEQSVREAAPITDVRGSREYREEMIRRSVRRCFEGILKMVL